MKNEGSQNFKLEIILQGHSVVPFFSDEKWGYLRVSMPNIIAVKNKIKPAARINIVSDEAAIELAIFCRDNKIFYFKPSSDSEIKYVFISKDRRLLEELNNIPHHFFYEDDLRTVQRKKISKYLGYPPCCINAHIGDDVCMKEYLNSIPNEISFLFNNFINPISNFFLSFHSPCSFLCPNTYRYNREIFSAILEEDCNFARLLEYYLAKPVLVFGSKTSFNDFWNSRFVILFDGLFSSKNEIKYGNVFKAIPFEDNFLMDVFEKKFNSLYELLKGGDRVLIGDDSFFVYKNAEMIGSCDRHKEYASAIFNFK